MKRIIFAIASVMLAATLTACGKEEPKVEKKDIFQQPYTETIPRTGTAKTERLFDFKAAKPKDPK